jgi:hypothetical protein
MSDIFSVLGSAYASAPLATPNVKYTPVDAKSYEGGWSGTYSNGQNSNSRFQRSLAFARESNIRAEPPRSISKS